MLLKLDTLDHPGLDARGFPTVSL